MRPSARSRSYSGAPGNGVRTVICTSKGFVSSTNSLTASNTSGPSPSSPRMKHALTAMPWPWIVRIASRYRSSCPCFQLRLVSSPSRAAGLTLSSPTRISRHPASCIIARSPGSSATDTSVSVNQWMASNPIASTRSRDRRLTTKVLSSASSTKGWGHISFIARISAPTLAGGLSLYRGDSITDDAQNSHRHGQPRWVWTVSRL